MNKYFLLSFLLLGFIWSCSDSELITPGDEFQPVSGSGTYSVEIDGVLADFSDVTSATSSAGSSQIKGQNPAGHSSVITLPNALTVGVFTESSGATISINLGSQGLFTNIGADGELLTFDVNISNVNQSDGKVTGTFMGTVYNADTNETVSLTNGKFIEIQFEPSPQSNRLLKADFNGNAFDFSHEAEAVGVLTAAVIQGVNTNQVQTLSITVPGGIGVATFTEADQVVLKVKLDSSNNPNDFYTNYDEVNDTYLPVTLKITTLTDGDNGRVIGTFSGTITKFSNGVPGEEIEVTAGQINVPVVTP